VDVFDMVGTKDGFKGDVVFDSSDAVGLDASIFFRTKCRFCGEENQCLL